MGYTIQYGTSKYDMKKLDIKKKRLIISLCLLCVVMLVCTAFSAQVRDLRRHILPFLEPNVQDAFENMTAQLEDGVGFKDAAAAFCREIIFETQIDN